MGVAVLSGTAGLGFFLLRSRPSLRLHSLTLWSALLGLASLLLVGISCGWEGSLILGIPSLVIGLALAANTAWGKGQLRALPADLGEEERQRVVDRVGRRIWFPLMSVVGVVGGLLAWGAAALVF